MDPERAQRLGELVKAKGDLQRLEFQADADLVGLRLATDPTITDPLDMSWPQIAAQVSGLHHMWASSVDLKARIARLKAALGED